jgi:radical SAM protein with 4Fe4S-binding SPASM domain
MLGNKMLKLKKINTVARIIGNSYTPKIKPSLNYINISITSVCNLDCIMCEARNFRKECFTSIKFETFKRIIDQAIPLGLETINLAATGESTIHKNFSEMVDYANKKKLNLRLVTNLNHINDKILNALSKFEQIHISIDGCTKKTYEKIRKGADWDKLIENIKKLEKTIKKTNLVVNFCVQKDNYKELPLLCDTFLPLGFKEINVGGLMAQSDMNNNIKIKEEEWNEFIKICEKTNKIFKKNNLNIPRVIDVEKLKKTKDPSSLRLGYNVFKVPCYHYHFNLYITPNGNVYPCCFFDYNEGLTGEKKLSAGNINKSSLKEIWNGKKINELRKELINKKFPKECMHCSNSINFAIHKKIKPFIKK